MDGIQESFACRMVRRRVSLKNDHDNNEVLNSSPNRDLQRRNNILEAIDDADFHRKLFKEMENNNTFDKNYDYRSTHEDESGNLNNNNKEIDSYNKVNKISEISAGCSSNNHVPSYVKSFELGRVKWRGPVAQNYLKRSSNNFKQIDDDSGSYSLSTNDSYPEEPTELTKVTGDDIKLPTKIIAGLTNVGNKSEESLAGNLEETSPSMIFSLSLLSAEINDIDAEIEALELEQANNLKTHASTEPPNRIYPALEDIEFLPTGWTPQKDCNPSKNTAELTETARFTKKVENNYAADLSNSIKKETSESLAKDNLDEITAYNETPKKSKRKIKEKMPLMKSAQSDSTKNKSKREIKEEIPLMKSAQSDSTKNKSKREIKEEMPLMKSARKSAQSDSTKNKFSPDAKSTISTVTTLNIPEYENVNAEELRGTQGTLDITTPFEVDRFLEAALGDELNNTSVTFDFSDGRTNSLFNASELVSNETTPLPKRATHSLHPPNTDPPRGSTNTPNRSNGFYRTLSKRIKKKFRLNQKPKEDSPEPAKNPKVDHEKGVDRQLLQEVKVQQTFIDQASKALDVCCTTKKFMESPERVEAERLLLIADLRRTAALDEIDRVASLSRIQEKPFLGERREVTLKDIRLNLRKCLSGEPQEGETVEWFVVVVSQGLNVWATRAISCPINNLRIDFPEVISVPNLTPKFKILVQVYSLKLKQATYNHEDKYKIRRKKRNSSCPPFLRSTMHLFKKSEAPQSPKPRRNNAAKTGHKGEFVLSGYVELFLHDLDLRSPWPLHLVPENSILDRTIDLSLSYPPGLTVSHEGFVNHGNEAGGFACWNRRWCVLKGRTLMFWNYPRDQETKEPLNVIELMNCVNKKITTANRTICSKPRTLLIETVRPRNSTDRNSVVIECKSSRTIIRNFLSFDNTQELQEWSTKLNHVVQELREWGGIGTMPAPISDL